MIEEQQWRPIPGYEGIYEASSLGSIRSLARPASPRGQARRERILRTSTTAAGYHGVSLWLGGKRVRQLVHRLVLLAFVGECPEGSQACHGDGDRANNSLSNLRWDTLVANQADRARHGTAFTRDTHPQAKIRRADITRAIQLRSEGMTHQQIADLMGVSRRAVGAALQDASHG